MGTLVLKTQPSIATPPEDVGLRHGIDVKPEAATFGEELRSLYDAVPAVGPEPADGTLVLVAPPTYDL